MSILKSILHRYNTTSQDYDTLHPETEYAQVTDFGEGTIAHLISSALASTVTACSTGSVFGKLVEKLLDASGMRYNFTNSNAWYICLGSLFGGLIIQGGTVRVTSVKTYEEFQFPISFPNHHIEHLASGLVQECQGVAITGANYSAGRDSNIYFRVASEIANKDVRWMALGY